MNENQETSPLINIKVSKGVPYIWDHEDWLKLRSEHRIVGGLDGPVPNGFGGRVRWNLPMRLSQVEVQYLVAQGIAKTVHAPSLYDENPVIDSAVVEKVLEERKQKHLEEYKNKRKCEIEQYMDKMLEGKRKKGRLGDAPMDKAAFLQKELDKITQMRVEMYQLDLKDPWLEEEDYLPFDFPIPSTYLEKLRFRVFEDFHLHKKYWVTPGNKFGGDFLAYPGDPRHFHGEYIIVCLEKDAPFNDFVVSQCRLAVTVKKTLIIATLDEETDKLMYQLPHARKKIDVL